MNEPRKIELSLEEAVVDVAMFAAWLVANPEYMTLPFAEQSRLFDQYLRRLLVQYQQRN